MLWLVLVATAASVLQEVTSLRHFADAPIEGPSPLYSLDGGDWTATNSRLNVRPCLSRTTAPTLSASAVSVSVFSLAFSAPAAPALPLQISMNATVPGDIISDLQRAGLHSPPFETNSPLFETEWLNSSARALWQAPNRNWTYSKRFVAPVDTASHFLQRTCPSVLGRWHLMALSRLCCMLQNQRSL